MEGETILFNKAIAVTIRTSERDERLARITVLVKLLSRTINRGKIQLTDETDPLFLFMFEVAEEDFLALKAEQNILVDFSAFPVKFIELLEQCLTCEQDPMPRFLCQLRADRTQHRFLFCIIETNQFKHLTHLALVFSEGDDIAIKKYLVQAVRTLKDKNAALQDRLVEQERLHQKKANELVQEFESEKASHVKEKGELQLSIAEHTQGKLAAEAKLSELRLQASKSEDALKTAQDEIKKGNDIIQRLQNELRSTKSNLKMKTAVGAQHERLLEERQRLLTTQQNELTELRDKVHAVDLTVEQLQTQLSVATKQLEERRKTIENNENVINWLNKEINDRLMVTGGFSPEHEQSSPGTRRTSFGVASHSSAEKATIYRPQAKSAPSSTHKTQEDGVAAPATPLTNSVDPKLPPSDPRFTAHTPVFKLSPTPAAKEARYPLGSLNPNTPGSAGKPSSYF